MLGWPSMASAVGSGSWLSISQNIVGLLYEVIVDERFRHQLGQFYTPEDVVDVLTAFAIRDPNDLVLDPAAGGGSFPRSAYARKRTLGGSHERALAGIWGWGCEITAFAAELSTVTLATSDTHEAAAYPRVLLLDSFDLRPGLETPLEIPGILGRLIVPQAFDAVIGNPPYISYRHITNQDTILNALASDTDLALRSSAARVMHIYGSSFMRHVSFAKAAGLRSWSQPE
jgi:type I restriction-modification system DNA methylase subunit